MGRVTTLRALLILTLAPVTGCAYDPFGPSEPADASLPTVRRDGGSRDAGGADAGDAGDADAGPVDAGGRDGGVTCTPDPEACVGRCGDVDDGCRIRACGGCPLPTTCGGGGEANRCGCQESEATFCASQSKTCGPATGNDHCGQPRSVDCGTCACVPEAKATFCLRGGARCGAFTTRDNCSRERTEDCGACGAGMRCGASNACECAPETASAFCSRLGKTCGGVTAADNCGTPRTESCGSCTGSTCSSLNTCVCTPETNAAFCLRSGKNCGRFTGTDNCGSSRTAECGACGFTCTGNVCVCTPPTDAELCTQELLECGTQTVTDECNTVRSPDCGTCAVGTCRNNACGCGVGDWDVSTIETGPSFGASLAVATYNFGVHVAYSDDRVAGHATLKYATHDVSTPGWTKEVVTLTSAVELGATGLGIGRSYTGAMLRIAVVDAARTLQLVSRTQNGGWSKLALDATSVDARGPIALRVGISDTYGVARRNKTANAETLKTRIEIPFGTPPPAGAIASNGPVGQVDIALDESAPQVYTVVEEGAVGAETIVVLRRDATTGVMSRDVVGPGTSPAIAVDDQLGVHVVYAPRASAACLNASTPCQTAISESFKPVGATAWTTTTVTTLPSHPKGHAIRLRYRANVMYAVVYAFAAKQLSFLYRRSAQDPLEIGVVSSGAEIGTGLDMAVDANAGVHVVFTELPTGSLRYAYRCPR